VAALFYQFWRVALLLQARNQFYLNAAIDLVGRNGRHG
jgi:hypothetical protein